MKKLVLLLSVLYPPFSGYTQNVGIGTATPNASAILDISGTSGGL